MNKEVHPFFSEYMQEALYDEKKGYYTQNIDFGADFITAPLLNECLAFSLYTNIKQSIELVRKALKNPVKVNIIECGGGNALLAQQLLNLLQQDSITLSEYHFIEISPKLQELQQETIKNIQSTLPNCPISWSKNWQEFAVKQKKDIDDNISHLNIIIANELFDAFPCDIYQKIEDEFFKLAVVDIDAKRCFKRDTFSTEISNLASQTALTHEELSALPSHYLLETQPYYAQFILEMTQVLNSLKAIGIGFWIDYGYENTEFYHHQRKNGTHQGFYKHQKTSVLENKGLQDITAHVPFTYLATIFDELGHQILGYTSQSQFIQGSFKNDSEKLQQLSEQNPHALLKLLGQEMGDVFKVMTTLYDSSKIQFFNTPDELFNLQGFQGRSRLQFL